jgi:E3 ubiquitin-protein ligase TRIP12
MKPKVFLALSWTFGVSHCFSGGAAALDPPFTVQKAPNPKLLPSSSTCFNLLKLPPYDSLDDLSAKIRIAVNEGLHSFALV